MRIVSFILAVWFWTAAAAHAEGVAREAKAAVVMIDVGLPGDVPVERGAGVIVQVDDTSIYIVTASHVVEMIQKKEMGLTATARLYGSRVQRRPLHMIAAEPTLDLALVRILFAENADIVKDSLSVANIATSLAPGGVFVVGQGTERAWNSADDPDTSAHMLGGSKIALDGPEVDAGDSGGGIFDLSGNLVGIVQGRPLQSNSDTYEDYVVGASSRAVLEYLAGRGLNYSANDAMRCLSGQRELQGAQIALTASTLAEAIATVNLDLLSSFKRACAPVPLISQALQQKIGEDTAVWRMLSAKGREDAAAQWLKQSIAGGLDPDMRVPGANYPSQSLLSLAIGAENAPVILALLQSGAMPNPFVDEHLAPESASRFLYPLAAVADMKNLSDGDKAAVISAFLERGVYVPANDLRKGLFMPASANRSQSNLEALAKYAKGRQPAATSICAKASNPWCARTVPLPPVLIGANNAAEIEDLDVGPLMAFDDSFGYYPVRSSQYAMPWTGLDTVPIYNDWGVLIVNRDGTSLRVRTFDDGRSGGGVCRDGRGSPDEYCWRDRNLAAPTVKGAAWVYNGDVPLKPSAEKDAFGKAKRQERDQYLAISAQFVGKLNAAQQRCYRRLSETASIAKIIDGYMAFSETLPGADPTLQRLYQSMNFSMLVDRRLAPYDPLSAVGTVMAKAHNVCASS